MLLKEIPSLHAEGIATNFQNAWEDMNGAGRAANFEALADGFEQSWENAFQKC